MTPGPWQIRSNTTKGVVLAIGSLLLGIILVWLTWKIPYPDSNVVAGLWLGVLLSGLGLSGILLAEDVVTTVDPARRSLRIQRSRRWGSNTLDLQFDDVAYIRVARVGTRSSGTPTFWLQIEMTGGKSYSPGRWSTNEAEIRQLAGKLSGQIGCTLLDGGRLNPATAVHVAVSAAGAVILYAAWFRFSVGPWCPAMWFGTAPPVFVLAAFALLLGLSRRLWI